MNHEPGRAFVFRSSVYLLIVHFCPPVPDAAASHIPTWNKEHTHLVAPVLVILPYLRPDFIAVDISCHRNFVLKIRLEQRPLEEYCCLSCSSHHCCCCCCCLVALIIVAVVANFPDDFRSDNRLRFEPSYRPNFSHVLTL